MLVVGLLRHDAGKTTVAEGLLRSALERGLDVAFSKPIGAFNAWYQFDVLAESAKLGVLAGEDLLRLHRASRSSRPIEAEGPVAGLVAPPDPEALGWRLTLYEALTSSVEGQLVLLRLTRCPGLSSSSPSSTYLLSRRALHRTTPSLREAIEELVSSCGARPLEVDQNELSRTLSEGAPLVAEECLGAIEAEEPDLLLVESFNDAVAPTRSSLRADAVVLVAPGRAIAVSGRDYSAASEAAGASSRPWASSTSRVAPLLRPAASVEVEPARRSSAWADELLDSLLSAGGKRF